ncbi:MAG: hypothetical protein QM756_00685 [Polyangiaceae bacterium]
MAIEIEVIEALLDVKKAQRTALGNARTGAPADDPAIFKGLSSSRGLGRGSRVRVLASAVDCRTDLGAWPLRVRAKMLEEGGCFWGSVYRARMGKSGQ